MTYNLNLPEKPAWWGAIAAFMSGMVVHLFGIVTVLHNHDSIYNAFNSVGSSVASGRWFLKILGDMVEKTLGGSYNLSWFNGAVFILLLAVAVYFLTDMFDIQSCRRAILIGVAFVTFPTATSTLLFRYTAVYYGCGIVLAVLASWSMVRYKSGFVLTVVFTALSLGIYQAYFPLTVSIFVVYLLKMTLMGQHSVKELFFRGVGYCSAMLGGVIVYFALMYLSLDFYDVTLVNYQNIDQIGRINLSEIPRLVLNAFTSFFTAPVEYSARYRLASTPLLQLAYMLTLVASIIIIVTVTFKQKKVSISLFTLFLCLVFPVAVNLIVIMSSEWIYTLMVYPFVMIIILPLILWDVIGPVPSGKRHSIQLLGRVVAVVLSTIILCNAYTADFNYMVLYYANRQTENYVSALVTQIRMMDGFSTEKKWAMIGNISDPLLQNNWMVTAPHVKYGGNVTSEQLLSTYSMKNWIESYVGYNVPAASDAQISSLKKMEEVKNMPCWPNAGSIRIVEDVIVIKFQEF